MIVYTILCGVVPCESGITFQQNDMSGMHKHQSFVSYNIRAIYLLVLFRLIVITYLCFYLVHPLSNLHNLCVAQNKLNETLANIINLDPLYEVSRLVLLSLSTR